MKKFLNFFSLFVFMFLMLGNVNAEEKIKDRPAQFIRGSLSRYYHSETARGNLDIQTREEVVLSISVDKLGKATKVVIIKSNGNIEVDEAAKRAGRRAKYKPAIKNGQYIDSKIRINLIFQPPQQTKDKE